MEYDGLSRRKALQRFDGGDHFHAIVGRGRTVTRALPSFLALLNDDVGPAPWTGIPETTPVRIDLNLRECAHKFSLSCATDKEQNLLDC